MTAIRFGIHLHQQRNQRRVSLQQLATRSGVSASQISRIETNTRNTPKPTTIKKLAEGLGVSYEKMLEAAGYIDLTEYRELEDAMTALIAWHNREIKRLENEIRNTTDRTPGRTYHPTPCSGASNHGIPIPDIFKKELEGGQ